MKIIEEIFKFLLCCFICLFFTVFLGGTFGISGLIFLFVIYILGAVFYKIPNITLSISKGFLIGVIVGTAIGLIFLVNLYLSDYLQYIRWC